MQPSSRAKLLFLIGVFVVPVLLAYLAYFGVRPTTHSNYGDLLPVTPLQHTAGVSGEGGPFDLTALRGKWLMVHVGPSHCDAACRQQLYLMRQIRIAQGKEQARIERLWVVTDAGGLSPALLQAHAGLHVWRPDSPAFVSQFPATAARSGHIYLVDPLGNLMLRFPVHPAPREVMKDLRLLLKASQIG
ncbi:MAG: SCO family protein [Thiobacillus sp.]